MRRVVGVAIVLALLWCGWWAAASFALHRGMTRVIAAHATDGWQVNARTQGFPFRIATRIDNVTIADPVNQMTWRLNEAQVSAPAYWPGYAAMYLPETPITVQTLWADFQIDALGAGISIAVAPGLSLPLRSVTAQADNLQLRSGNDAMIQSDGFYAAFEQSAADPTQYDLRVDLPQLAPGAVLRDLMGVTHERPPAFDAFEVEGAVTFDDPIDRHALWSPPQPQKVSLDQLRIAWGDIAILAEGAIDIDSSGLPEGTVQIEMRNWRRALDLVTAAGVLTGATRLRYELTLGALANLGDGGDDLDLTLAFAKGRASLGPIDLGPAPRFYLQQHSDQ